MGDKDLPYWHNQHNGCWWLGITSSQSIGCHSTKLDLLNFWSKHQGYNMHFFKSRLWYCISSSTHAYYSEIFYRYCIGTESTSFYLNLWWKETVAKLYFFYKIRQNDYEVLQPCKHFVCFCWNVTKIRDYVQLTCNIEIRQMIYLAGIKTSPWGLNHDRNEALIPMESIYPIMLQRKDE